MTTPSDAQVNCWQAVPKALRDEIDNVIKAWQDAPMGVSFGRYMEHALSKLCAERDRAALTAAAKAAPPTEADMRAFGANEAACYKWPDDSTWHKACRAAYCQGAADYGGAAPTLLGRADDGPFCDVTADELRRISRKLCTYADIYTGDKEARQMSRRCREVAAVLDKAIIFSAPAPSSLEQGCVSDRLSNFDDWGNRIRDRS